MMAVYFLAEIAALALIVTAGFVAVAVLAARRRARQASLLWLLAIAVEKELPLEDELEAWSDGLKGRERSDAIYLADVLRSGDSLPDALAFIPGLIPRHAVTAAHVGAESGRLAEALRNAAVRHQTQWHPQSAVGTSFMAGLLYSAVVLAYATYILLFLMYHMIPKFRKIFEDFDTELPRAMIGLIDVSDLVVQHFYLVVIGGMAAVGLIALIGWATIRGWGEFRLEWLGPALTRVDAPGVLRNLALVTASGLPIETGLATIAREHRRTNIRRRAAMALAECEQGADPWQGLGHAGLLTGAEVELLSAAQATDNVSWALREIADTIEERRWFRWAAIVEAVQPIAVLALGAIVLVICVSFFLPLVKLINDLS